MYTSYHINLNNRLALLFILLFISSCAKQKDNMKDTINVLTNTNNSFRIDENIANKEFSLDNVTDVLSFDSKSKHYGNVILENLNNKKIIKLKRLKYSNRKTDLPFFITPLIRNNMIYLIDIKGKIVAYDKHNKKIIWKQNLDKSVNTYNILKGGINFYEDKLYITFGSNTIFSLDPKNGNILWQKKLDSLLRSMPYIYNNKLYLLTLNNKLYCLSPKDGQIIWQKSFLDNLSSQFGNSGLNNRGVIMAYGNSSGEIIILDSNKGEVIWKENIGSINLGVEHFNFYDVDSMPIIFDKKLYAVSSNGRIAAFEYISGVKIWEQKLSARKTPWITKNLLFIIDNNNRLVAFTQNSGKIKWYVELNKEILPDREDKLFYGPVVINQKVFVSNNKGKLTAFDYNSGKLLLNYKIPKNINHFPIINDNKLYMINNKSVLYEYQ